MPGLDRKGPSGQGPMTGRGMGQCRSTANRQQNFGLGRGCGRGFGYRNSSGSGAWNQATANSSSEYSYNEELAQKIEKLENELQELKAANEDINNQR